MKGGLSQGFHLQNSFHDEFAFILCWEHMAEQNLLSHGQGARMTSMNDDKNWSVFTFPL